MASSSPTANPPQPANNDNMATNTSSIADTGFTDESLDRDWKPNGRRPQSYVSFRCPLLQPLRTDSLTHCIHSSS